MTFKEMERFLVFLFPCLKEKQYLCNKINGTIMIVVESKRKREATLKKAYGDECIIIDCTSHADDEFQKFSPFYPHGGIPVPNSPGFCSYSVEGIWQGLKMFQRDNMDTSCFRNATMKNLKRTTRRFGACKGHRRGVTDPTLLGYIEARHILYLPSYKWVLDNKCQAEVEKIKTLAKTHTVVLLDYETNCDVDDPTQPLSHASLVKAYCEGNYPE